MQSRIVSPKRVSAALECVSPQTVQEAGVWGPREGLGYTSSYFLSHSLCRTGIGALCVGTGVMQMCGHRCDASAPLSTGGIREVRLFLHWGCLVNYKSVLASSDALGLKNGQLMLFLQHTHDPKEKALTGNNCSRMKFKL